jgi:hypothetical protein
MSPIGAVSVVLHPIATRHPLGPSVIAPPVVRDLSDSEGDREDDSNGDSSLFSNMPATASDGNRVDITA